MKQFTKESLNRAWRTFIQAVIAYLTVNIVLIDWSDSKEAVKSALIGVLISAFAAGISAIMNRETVESECGGGTLSFDKWVKSYYGQKLDPDRYAGVQCVDLIKHYCHYVLGITKAYSSTWGNAIDWCKKYGYGGSYAYLKSNFKKIKYTKGMKIQKGDVAVFSSKSPYGHIAVCTGDYNKSSFVAYDQNYNGTGAGMTKRTFAYTGNRKLVCILRPKNQSMIVTVPSVKPGTYKLTTNRKVYKDWGSSSGQLKVKDLTADGKKNATSSKANSKACLKKGTLIDIVSVKKLSTGHLWAKIPSGYICIWNYDSNTKYIK